MTVRYEDHNTTQWTASADFSEEAHYIKYAFKLTDTEGKTCWLNSLGVQDTFILEGSYEILQINDTDIVSVPEWAEGCIYYQIFPERFAKGSEERHDLAAWDSAPTRDNYMGGTLSGITDKIPYLSDLGVECIYLNPIFLADFNHKYATTDYFQIDPLFGTEQDLIFLVDIAHRNGIKIILDGVFNHVGIHFAPFEDLVRNGEDSQYREWFMSENMYGMSFCTGWIMPILTDGALMLRMNWIVMLSPGGGKKSRRNIRMQFSCVKHGETHQTCLGRMDSIVP